MTTVIVYLEALIFVAFVALVVASIRMVNMMWKQPQPQPVRPAHSHEWRPDPLTPHGVCRTCGIINRTGPHIIDL